MRFTKRKESLIVFANPAIAGRTKTRLTKEIGIQPALELYKSFLINLSDIAANIYKRRKSVSLIAEWSIDNTEELTSFPLSKWLPGRFLHRKQNGRNLGERMISSLGRRIAYDSNAVLIGSDIPGIDEETIINSFEFLINKQDAKSQKKTVIGPSEDGGFYLIGMNRFNNCIFNEIDWDSEDTFKCVTNNLRNECFLLKFLPEKIDVDFIKDIEKVLSKSKQNQFTLNKRIRSVMEKLITK